ncbi:ABC transporter ATP-binding protein/permease [Reyranella sp. MMS21-HV4-11]|uniref:ABC transporter ATP-binding protein/permease n=1 Tax=Reyranella humidisoli TaxID=2849149 RepID=A0ABS6IJF1_9HYPH|nr:ABC transporter ATP-binding protein/permease [Reyranella sp. MMS21-HV4-11]MBU8873887.1 ABC transporter ATP-binding protein/permease [Reyranella sp. MMS21-HV4-11]
MDTPHSSIRAFAAVASGYWTAPGYRAVAWSLTGGLVVLGAANVGIALWLNIWNRDFFNALDKRDVGQLMELLWMLAAIVASAGVAVAIQLHVKRRLQINWRSWLSHVTVQRWLNGGRQYQLGMLADEVDNPDGRIAEDIRVSTEFAVEFAQSILQCVLQLFTFLSVLWILSGTMPIKLFGFEFNLPGYMVWAAVAYALVGSLLTYFLGRGLIHAGNIRQSREADFRSGLTRAREHAEGIALMRGEDDERERLRGSLFDLRSAWNVQTRGQGNLSLLTSSLAYLAPIVPLIVALPRYLGGEIALGGLMQTAQAFSSVQWALSWLIDNFPKFAEWRASTDRLVHLHVALTDLEESSEMADEERIVVHPPAESDRLIMRELGVARPSGEMLVAEAEVEIQRAERVLIRGQSGSGKSTIMRAVAGVWPWGRGAIHLPTGNITFMPQKPYFPLGTLRDVMLYPAEPEGVSDDVLKDMLHKVGLDHLRDRLDETERWDHILSGGEQQRVAFARVLVQKPDWIFMDEATSALDEAGQENVMKLLIEELPETSVVSIGHRPGLEVFHTRELTLEPGADGTRLRSDAGKRSLGDLYRKMAAASRSTPRDPGFWAHVRASLLGR